MASKLATRDLAQRRRYFAAANTMHYGVSALFMGGCHIPGGRVDSGPYLVDGRLGGWHPWGQSIGLVEPESRSAPILLRAFFKCSKAKSSDNIGSFWPLAAILVNIEAELRICLVCKTVGLDEQSPSWRWRPSSSASMSFKASKGSSKRWEWSLQTGGKFGNLMRGVLQCADNTNPRPRFLLSFVP